MKKNQKCLCIPKISTIEESEYLKDVALLNTIITTWRGITCRIAVTIEGVENAYLPGNVHFQYRP